MDTSRLVYSTDSGRMCPACEKPVSSCTCPKKRTVTQTDGVIRIRREAKGRGGKTVTIVSGFQLGDDDLKDLSAGLKRLCGTGGSVKDGEILIQGDHRQTLLVALKKRGFTTKLAGG
jgi:translation initiation factor 1